MPRSDLGPYVARMLKLELIRPQQVPLGKLRALVDAVTSGRLREDNLKTMDGISAWGALLLVFGREWHAGTHTRVIKIDKAQSNVDVEKFVSKLFDLNEFRHPLAQRHTVLEILPVEQVRKRTFSMISEICEIQAPLEKKSA